MSNAPEIVDSLILKPNGLDPDTIQGLLAPTMKTGVDLSDLYFQHIRQEVWALEDGIVKEGSYNIDCGVGVRVVSGEQTGFSYSSDLSPNAIKQAAQAASSIVRSGQSGTLPVFQQASPKALYGDYNPLDSMTSADKVALLKRIDESVRAMDPRIQEVSVSLSGLFDCVLIAASDGTYVPDIRPLIRFNVSVIAEENGRRERGGAGGGGRFTYERLTQNGLPERFAKEAVRIAQTNLAAQPSPAGTMPIVLGSGWPGVLLHEAVGHGLEGDFNRKGSSAFSGRVGEKVASDLCTVVDDGTLSDRRGSLSVDDEGTPTGYNVLIEKGVLKGYMQDKTNARLMGVNPTGNGRRQSYSHVPMPRMTNTYMLAGEHDPEEIIASIDKGIYAVNFGGGQVDITSGKFVFSSSEAYMIEKGKVTHPVKGATLIGNGPAVMQKVSMVGNDLALDEGVGTCGKEGQSVPVGVGQPSLKIDEIVVGGTQ